MFLFDSSAQLVYFLAGVLLAFPSYPLSSQPIPESAVACITIRVSTPGDHSVHAPHDCSALLVPGGLRDLDVAGSCRYLWAPEALQIQVGSLCFCALPGHWWLGDG